VIKPGNPLYLEYVRSSIQEKRVALEQEVTELVNGVGSRFSGRTLQQYDKRLGQAKLNIITKGNPNLVYESRLHNSFEPTGVPVCLIPRNFICIVTNPSEGWCGNH